MSKIYYIVFALLLTACVKQDPNADLYHVYTNVYGEVIRWNSYPVKFVMDPNTTTVEQQEAVLAAANIWNRPNKTLIVVEIKTPSSKEPTKDSENVIYFMNKWESNRSSEQGRTSLYWVGNQIHESDIRINLKDFNFYWHKNSTGEISSVELESLLVHEFGHVLGLMHKETSSVMNTYLAAQTVRKEISDKDREALNYLLSLQY